MELGCGSASADLPSSPRSQILAPGSMLACTHNPREAAAGGPKFQGQVKALATKLGNLNSIPEIHMVGGGN